MEDKLDALIKKMDTLIIIELAKSGIPKKQIAKILRISDNTIDKILSYTDLKRALDGGNE